MLLGHKKNAEIPNLHKESLWIRMSIISFSYLMGPYMCRMLLRDGREGNHLVKRVASSSEHSCHHREPPSLAFPEHRLDLWPGEALGPLLRKRQVKCTNRVLRQTRKLPPHCVGQGTPWLCCWVPLPHELRLAAFFLKKLVGRERPWSSFIGWQISWAWLGYLIL